MKPNEPQDKCSASSSPVFSARNLQNVHVYRAGVVYHTGVIGQKYYMSKCSQQDDMYMCWMIMVGLWGPSASYRCLQNKTSMS